MKLQKTQLRLIILLNALLLILVAAIAAECIIGGRDLFSPPVGAQTPADESPDETPKPEYSRGLRCPTRLSLKQILAAAATSRLPPHTRTTALFTYSATPNRTITI